MTLAWLLADLRGDWRRNRGAWLVAVAGFAAAVVLLAGARLISWPAPPPRAAAAARVEVIAYLRDELSSEEITALTAVLAAVPGVEEIRRVGAAEALARMRGGLGRHARLLDGAEDGLLPRSLEVTMASVADAAARARQLGERLRRLPDVIDVDELEPPAEPAAAPRGGNPDRWRRALQVLLGAGAVAGLLAALVPRLQRRRQQARVRLALGATPLAAFLPAVAADLLAALAGTGLGLAVVAFALDGAWARAGFLSRLGAAARAAPLLSRWEAGAALALALLLAALAGYRRARVADPADA